MSASRCAGLAALRARDVDPLLVGRQRRLALGPVVLDLGQLDRQLILGHGDEPVVLAVDDRDRAAPVALARERPVSEAIADRGRAAALLAQPLDDLPPPLLDGQAGELAGVDQHAGLLVDHRPDRQVVALGELAVALVVRRDGHDRAGSVVHQHVVGDPDRDPLVVDRVDDVVAGEETDLLLRLALLDGPRRGFLRVGDHLVVSQLADDRVLRRQDEERRAEQRVRPGREDGDVQVELLVPEDDLGALRAADPVRLDRLRPLGPVDQLQVLQQLIGVGGDLEEPLLHVPRDHRGAAAVALAVDRRTRSRRRSGLSGTTGQVRLSGKPGPPRRTSGTATGSSGRTRPRARRSRGPSR